MILKVKHVEYKLRKEALERIPEQIDTLLESSKKEKALWVQIRRELIYEPRAVAAIGPWKRDWEKRRNENPILELIPKREWEVPYVEDTRRHFVRSSEKREAWENGGCLEYMRKHNLKEAPRVYFLHPRRIAIIRGEIKPTNHFNDDELSYKTMPTMPIRNSKGLFEILLDFPFLKSFFRIFKCGGKMQIRFYIFM